MFCLTANFRSPQGFQPVLISADRGTVLHFLVYFSEDYEVFFLIDLNLWTTWRPKLSSLFSRGLLLPLRDVPPPWIRLCSQPGPKLNVAISAPPPITVSVAHGGSLGPSETFLLGTGLRRIKLLLASPTLLALNSEESPLALLCLLCEVGRGLQTMT